MTYVVQTPQSGAYPYSAVVSITVTWPDGTASGGSGVMVGANDVLTAAHMVYSAVNGGAATSVTVTPGANGNSTPFGTYAAAEWYYYEWDTNRDGLATRQESQYDVAIIGLSQRLGDQTGWFGMDPNATTGWYNLTGYPAAYTNALGQPQMTNDWGQATEDPTWWVYDFVDITSTPGNSGGPLWYQAANGPYVVGICSTASWAADIYLTNSQLQAWMSEDDSLLSTTIATPRSLRYSNLIGYAASDQLFGHQGHDTIDGGEGNNTIVGGTDSADWADSLIAGGGADFILGNGGNDTISAGNGNNSLVGGFGIDSILSGSGNDIIWGNQNDDYLDTGGGNDLIFGGMGNDIVLAGAGNDTLYGNEGNDNLNGGSGADRYVFAPGSGADQIAGFLFGEGDRLDLAGQTYTSGAAGDGDALLFLSGGGSIELNGVGSASFQAGFVL
jgi:V8-like Glu-specific endopeptidase